MKKFKGTKISIIGSGFVGSTTAYALMLEGLASKIVIVDINKDKAESEAMDLSHGVPFVKPVEIISGEYEDTKDSNIVIITAGAGPKPGETRLDVINKNLNIFRSIVPEVVKYSPNSILLVVSNPVDILTCITYKLSGFPASRVLGSGTVLDTSRVKYLIGNQFDVDARNVHSYILGEHGDSEIVAWSLTSIAGMNMDDYCKTNCDGCGEEFKKNLADEVKNAGYQILNKKGYTNYAVALAVRRIVDAIVRDEDSILTVSSLLVGQYGIEGVYLGIPTVVGAGGAKKIIQVPLSKDEESRLKESAEVLKKHMEDAHI